MYKSEDGGDTWSSISQNFGRNLNHLKIAPSDNSVMYAAVRRDLFKKQAATNVWDELSGFSGNVNDVAIHPTNPEKIAIATNSSDRIYVSENGGQTWTSYRKNLPNFIPTAVAWHDNGEDGLYVGMNYGIYYIDNSLTEWESFSNNLPNVRVEELEINTAENKIYAATYGRGCWSSPVKEATLSVNDNELSSAFVLYPNPVKDILFLKSETIGKSSIRLFNNQGQLVYYAKDKNLQETVEIDTRIFAPGIYFLRLSTSKGEAAQKVIIR